MKKKLFARGGQTPPILVVVTLFLILAVVLSTPLALAKYIVSGTYPVQGATVASWNLAFGTNLTETGTAYAGGSLAMGPATKVFTITNNSQVAADVKIHILETIGSTTSSTDFTSVGTATTEVSAGTGGIATLTADVPNALPTNSSRFQNYFIQPGQTATFTLTLTSIGAGPTLRFYTVWFDAVQYDYPFM